MSQETVYLSGQREQSRDPYGESRCGEFGGESSFCMHRQNSILLYFIRMKSLSRDRGVKKHNCIEIPTEWFKYTLY